jgi:hypothetical protein
MNDYIIRFRKICRVLLADKSRTKGEIYNEMGITAKTMNDLLVLPEEKLHLHASTLGKVQDFVKKNNGYEHMNPEMISGGRPEQEGKERKRGPKPKPEHEEKKKEGNRLTILKSFTDEELCACLRRRGYSGELYKLRLMV